MCDKRKISVTVVAALSLCCQTGIWITHLKFFIVFLSNLTLNLIELGGVSFLAMPSASTCFKPASKNCDFLFAVPL